MKARVHRPAGALCNVWSISALLALTFALASCAIKLAPDYDSATFEEIIKVGRKVDRFYGDLLESEQATRQYQKYADRYVEIETDLRSLYMRNTARPLNEESTQISASILALWIKYKSAHKASDRYSDGVAKLDRNRFNRLFGSAANAEAAKKLQADDRDASQDSK
jgi:hypothetical protein